MKTRTSKPKSKPLEEPEETESQLQPSIAVPPQLFILPKGVTPETRIVSLIDHTTKSLRRYLFCPQTGLYELKRIAAPKRTPKAWLLSKSIVGNLKDIEHTVRQQSEEGRYDPQSESQKEPESLEEANLFSRGYVMKDAALFIATRLDPLFLLLPIFESALEAETKGKPRQFLSEDDHLDRICHTSKHMAAIIANQGFRHTLVKRLGTVSAMRAVGDEQYYKPDPERLVNLVIEKAKSIVNKAWPSSLEEEFVSKPLFIPTTNFTVSSSSKSSSDENDLSQSKDMEPGTDLSQASSTAAAELIVPVESPPVPEDVVESLRLRTGLNFILCSYFSKTIRDSLQKIIESHPKLNFGPLDLHLERSQNLRKEAQALRSLSENISRKRTLDDDEVAEAQAEKKRRKDEDEKRKKAESKALKDLKKADTSGMKKLSSFFVKAAPKAS